MDELASGEDCRRTSGRLNRLNGWVTLWLACASAIILAMIAVVTFVDVFLRYVFAAPFIFSVEMTEQLMGVIVYLAVGYTTHQYAHVSVDLVVSRLNRAFRAGLALIVNILGLAFLCTIVWRLGVHAFGLFETNVKTPILFWPIWPVAFVMSFGSLFLLTGFLLYIVNSWREFFSPERPTARRPVR